MSSKPVLAGLLATLFALPLQAAELASVGVKKQLMPEERWFDGVVQAVRQSTVSAETTGRVQKVLVDVGDSVKAGAVIIKLVSNEQQQGYNQASAALDEAQAALDLATREFARIEELYNKQLLAKADYDRSKGNLNAAKARVTSAEAAVKAANERLSYTEVRAPYSGMVSERLVEIGEAVRPGTPLMSGFDPLAYRVQTDIPQSIATLVEQQRKARAVTDSGEVFEPEKLLVFPQVDAATSTLRLRLELPRKPTDLHPGQFVKVAVVVGETERILIPQTSIVHRSEITAVYVIDKQQVQLRQVRLGNNFGEQVEVLSGLAVDEKIAADPVAAGMVAAGQTAP